MTSATAATGADDAPPPLDPEWLLAPLPPRDASAVDLDPNDNRFLAILDLVTHGNYAAAGHRAEQALHEGMLDMRIVGYYLFGVFVERGPASLPIVYRLLGQVLGPNAAAIGPSTKKEIHTENALLWLFSAMLRNVEHSAKQKDAAWQPWLEAVNRPAIDEALERTVELLPLVEQHSPKGRAVARLQSFDGWLRELTPPAQNPTGRSAEKNVAAHRGEGNGSLATEKPAESDRDQNKDEDDDKDEGEEQDDESQEAVQNDDDRENEDEDGADPDEVADEDGGRRGSLEEDAENREASAAIARLKAKHSAASPQGARSPSSLRKPAIDREEAGGRSSGVQDDEGVVIEGSAEWNRLVQRLRAFQELIDRGAYLKAAVVAADIQAALASFDPVVYFPSLFAPYLESFSDNMHPLETCMRDSASVQFKVLQKLYQVAPEKFLNEP